MNLQQSPAQHVIVRHAEIFLLLIAGGLFLLNQWHMMGIHALLPVEAATSEAGVTAGASSSIMLPHGVPARYGAKLGISFDDAASAMTVLENFDRGAGTITLTGELQQRYISIASQTACEFCCGATTLVFSDGKPACGCAHSAAMRGVALYLLQQYPEMTDAQILTEVKLWKAAFFPGPTAAKAGGKTNSQSTNSANSLPNQVGGC